MELRRKILVLFKLILYICYVSSHSNHMNRILNNILVFVKLESRVRLIQYKIQFVRKFS